MLHRLFTEDKNRFHIQQIVAQHFTSFTLIPASGFWKGEEEHSLIIEIGTTETNFNLIRDIADQIKRDNHQQAVMIQTLYPDTFII